MAVVSSSVDRGRAFSATLYSGGQASASAGDMASSCQVSTATNASKLAEMIVSQTVAGMLRLPREQTFSIPHRSNGDWTATSSIGCRTGRRASHRPTCRWNEVTTGRRTLVIVGMATASRSADRRMLTLVRTAFLAPARLPRRAQPRRRTRSRTSDCNGQ